MTSDFIYKALLPHVTKDPGNIVLKNVFIGRWEADLLRVDRDGVLTEFEVKTSRPDFFNDFKKGFRRYDNSTYSKHDRIAEGKRCSLFYFVVPANMVSKDEIPQNIGLLYVHPDGTILMEKRATRIKEFKMSEKMWKEIAFKLWYRQYEK